MNDRRPESFFALAAIASFYGFEDYALEVLTALIKKESDFETFEHKEKIQRILDSYSDPFSQPIRKGIHRVRKKASTWKVSPTKDCGYFFKD